MHEDRPLTLIARPTLVGALAGLLLGVHEGIHLYRTPVPSSLLRPDTSLVILFLAPLLDAAFAGAVGFAVGLFLFARLDRVVRRVWRFVAARWSIDLRVPLYVVVAATAAVFVLASPGVYSLGRRLSRILIVCAALLAGRYLRPRILALTLSIGIAVALAGVGAYVIMPFARASTAPLAENKTGKPNIILVTLDTVRADHLSLYGYARPTSPNMERWAKRGVVFEDAISSSSWTLPSHGSIFTGLLPHQHGANWDVPIDPSRWTLAKILHSWGYQTAGFTSNLSYGDACWGMGRGFDFYDDQTSTLLHNIALSYVGLNYLQPFYKRWLHVDDLERRDARQLNRDVLGWVQHRSSKPFFMFINYFDAHDPYFAPAPYSDRFGRLTSELVAKTEFAFCTRPAHFPNKDQVALIAGYDNCLAFLDESLSELLHDLSHLPGWENTIVIITSDHGESIGEDDNYGHGLNLRREELHVPLIIFDPKIPQGLRVPHLVRLRELFSTVLSFAGLDKPLFTRNSLERFWNAGYEPGESDEAAISEDLVESASWDSVIAAKSSIVTPKWHFIRISQGGEALYDWAKDPTEKVNLAQSSDYRQVVAELEARLRAQEQASLPPWRCPAYLFALAEPGQPPLNFPAYAPQANSGSVPGTLRIGDTQAYFPLLTSPSGRPQNAEEELLRSLPYH
jgi:arylsulfatase A-like enzyme